MDIFLQDLGPRRQAALLQRRAASINTGRRYADVAPLPAPETPPAPPRLNWLGRLWAHAADAPPEPAAAALDGMRGQAYGMVGGFVGGSLGFWAPAAAMLATGEPTLAAVFAAMGVAMSGAGLAVPAFWLRRVCGPPAAAAELQALRAATQDDLERAYLDLVQDAARQPIAPEAEKGMRAALRALGEAIDQLPIVAGAHADVAALRAEATRMLAEAAQEPDRVVAASRERRAEALERSADAAERSEALRRRAVALREEMQSQVESLHLGLTGFQTQSGDVAGLAQLADSVRAVATEAASVSAARAELDAALEPRRVTLPGGEALPLKNAVP